jgi:hypothetical protein
MLKDTRKGKVRRLPSIRHGQGKPATKAVSSGRNCDSLRRGEDIRTAQDWLASGAPIADVLTVLEVRHRFDLSASDCRAYAVEILRAAQGLSEPKAARTTNPKESPYAAA